MHNIFKKMFSYLGTSSNMTFKRTGVSLFKQVNE